MDQRGHVRAKPNERAPGPDRQLIAGTDPARRLDEGMSSVIGRRRRINRGGHPRQTRLMESHGKPHYQLETDSLRVNIGSQKEQSLKSPG